MASEMRIRKLTAGDMDVAYTKRTYIQSTNPNVSNHQLFY